MSQIGSRSISHQDGDEWYRADRRYMNCLTGILRFGESYGCQCRVLRYCSSKLLEVVAKNSESDPFRWQGSMIRFIHHMPPIRRVSIEPSLWTMSLQFIAVSQAWRLYILGQSCSKMRKIIGQHC